MILAAADAGFVEVGYVIDDLGALLDDAFLVGLQLVGLRVEPDGEAAQGTHGSTVALATGHHRSLQFLEYQRLAFVGGVGVEVLLLLRLELLICLPQLIQAVDIVPGALSGHHEAVLLLELQRLVNLVELVLHLQLRVGHDALAGIDGVVVGGIHLRNLSVPDCSHPHYRQPVQVVHHLLGDEVAEHLQLALGELMALAHLELHRAFGGCGMILLNLQGLVAFGRNLVDGEVQVRHDPGDRLLESAQVVLLDNPVEAVACYGIASEVGGHPVVALLLQVGAACAFVHTDLERLSSFAVVDDALCVLPQIGKDVKATMSGVVDFLFVYHDKFILSAANI